MIVSGQAKRVMVIGAETFSRIMDWTDRGTCVLFGDGAGALILEAAEGAGTSADRGILSVDLHSDGQFRDLLYVDGGVSTQSTGHLRMEGKEVFRHAVEKLAQTATTAMEKAGITVSEPGRKLPRVSTAAGWTGIGSTTIIAAPPMARSS